MSVRNVVKLRQEVLKWQEKIGDLEEQGRRASEQVDELEQQRGKQILGALAEADPVAKKQLEKFTVELERAERHSADLALACQQAGARVDALRQELAAAERAGEEERLLELLQQREAIGKQVGELVETKLLPLLRQASGICEEMSKLGSRLGLEYSIRAAGFTDLLDYPRWCVTKTFPIKLSTISMEPLEGRSFRPPDFALDPGPALAAHDQQFRRRLVKEIQQKRQPASGTKVTLVD